MASSVRLYDGNVERPDAWRANDGDDAQMRWVKSKSRQQRNLPVPSANRQSSRPNSPFSVGSASDGEPDPDQAVSPSTRPLPDDAVDLVVEDSEAREEAREHERRKGEPQAYAPAHVYVAQRSDVVEQIQKVYSPGVQDEQRVSEAYSPEEVGGTDPQGVLQSMDKEVELPRGPADVGDVGKGTARYGSLYDHEENPWA